VANQFLSFNEQFDYPIYFMGLKKDTIKIGRRYWRGRTEWKNDFDIPQTENYSPKTLQIIVDTSVKTNSPVEYFSDNGQVVKDSTSNYHSFLLLINNISDSAIYLGHSFSLYFIYREAKDRNGHWAKIEKRLSEMSLCTTGEPFIILKPHELIISKVKRYNGARLTEFRLAFGYNNNVVYSNSFTDFIDERVFKNSSK
jgi:hypothetical protein